MKIERFSKIPKQDLDDYTPAEQELLALMGGVRGSYKTDYNGMEKPLSIRLDCVNNPKVEAYAELSGLSKNLVVNRFLTLGFHVLFENLSDEDLELFVKTESRKMAEWSKEYENVKN